ncbi:hypothetical protein EG68_00027 [Paragonimus skrjabini miyazakii]|uniref:Secreted protein n=1 Tax=Paragonimus skrjabini miyazakii TaxID=59628 RepID=A0A8S9ZCY3_9TREM|nr:hypothetical protein EG68_00027 [Paragonimus skrjabini miyazakii]
MLFMICVALGFERVHVCLCFLLFGDDCESMLKNSQSVLQIQTISCRINGRYSHVALERPINLKKRVDEFYSHQTVLQANSKPHSAHSSSN